VTFLFSSLLEDRYLKWLLVLPLIILLLVITIFPTLYAYYMSVHRITIETFRSPVFIGLKNFLMVLLSGEFWYSLIFTIIFMISATSIELALGLALALLFRSNIRGKSIMIALILTPLAVAPALYGLMFRLMLDPITGVIPAMFKLIGVNISPLSTLTSTVISLIVIDALQYTPFVFLILFAALHALPLEPVEAALVDGASSWQIIRYVTLPLIKPAVIVATIFRFMDSFKTFDTIYVITGGGPGISTSTVTINVYKQTFLMGNFGTGAAATLILFYLSMMAITVIYKVMYRKGESSER